MYYFYCPKCGFEGEVKKLPHGTVGNPRDGYGRPIYHYKCSVCSNLDAGFMKEAKGDSSEKEYFKEIIKLYQGIRGVRDFGLGRETKSFFDFSSISENS